MSDPGINRSLPSLSTSLFVVVEECHPVTRLKGERLERGSIGRLVTMTATLTPEAGGRAAVVIPRDGRDSYAVPTG